MPFPLRDIRKNPRSMYARVPQAMAQFVLKIEKLSHIMGPTPNTRNGARLRSPSPIMAPGLSYFYFGNNLFSSFVICSCFNYKVTEAEQT